MHAGRFIDDAAFPPVQHANASVAEAREPLDDEGKQRALLGDVSEHPGTDDEMADEEKQFLSSVRAVFEIRP